MRSINIDEDIISVLNQFDRPVSTDEIAQKIDREWHSVQKYCQILKSKGKISGFRVGRMNLWVVEKGAGEE